MDKGLFSTDTDQKHHHIVFFRPDGTGQCASSTGHTHPVEFVSERTFTQPQLDQDGAPVLDGNAQPIQEQITLPEHWEIGPGGRDGHVHFARQIATEDSDRAPVSDDDEEIDDDEIVMDVRQKYIAAKLTDQLAIDRAKKMEKYYQGDMWETRDKTIMEADRRAMLNIGIAKAKIDSMSGYERRHRTDMAFVPEDNGTQVVADICSHILKDLTTSEDVAGEESSVFLDQSALGRGYFHVDTSKRERPDGKIEICHIPWDSVFMGPHIRSDCADCEYLVKFKWLSVSDVRQMLTKEQYQEIKDSLKRVSEFVDSGQVSQRYLDDRYMHESVGTFNDFYDVGQKRILQIELQRKEIFTVPIIYNTEFDFFLPARISKYMSDDDVNAALSLEGIDVDYLEATRVIITNIVGRNVISRKQSSLDAFTVIPVYANKVKNFWWGKMWEARDLSVELNKRHSQIAEWGNREAGADVQWYDDETFTPDQERKWLQDGAKMGYKGKVKDLNHIPRYGNRSANANLQPLMELETMSRSLINNVMNINEQILGQVAPNASGATILLAQMGALMGNEYLFDNMARAKRIMAKLVLRLIRKTWTVGRIIDHLSLISRKGTDVKLAGIPLYEWSYQALEMQLQNFSEEDYRVVTDESSSSPTRRMAVLAELQALNQASPGTIPFEVMLEFMDLPPATKGKLMQFIQQQRDSQAQLQDKSESSEVQKTIAKGEMNLKAIQLRSELGQQGGNPGGSMQTPPPQAMTPIQGGQIS